MSSGRSNCKLSGSRVSYSPGEEQVFSFLKEFMARDTEVLTRLHYGMGERPFNGRRVVVGLLSSLARKVVLNREPFRIRSTPRAGPVPKSFWLEPLSPARRSRTAASGPLLRA